MPQLDLRPGSLLAGKYRIERIVGEGGMGVVVAAEHVSLGQSVAIKILHLEASANLVERFVREARVVAEIGGRHVPEIFDVDRLPTGAPYVVMELLHGEDLGQLLARRGKLTVFETADLLLQACEPLSRAHGRGIVHRDLKSANLFLARSDGGPVLKVLDFGLAKLARDLENAKDAALTGTGSFLGSPAYMAPEQWVSAKQADARSDVWALGCVAYEALTGAMPFDAASLTDLFQRTLESTPPSPQQLDPAIPDALDQLVVRCLEKDPSRRFPGALELGAALRPFGSPVSGQWLDGPASARGGPASLPVSSEQGGRLEVTGASMTPTALSALGSAPTALGALGTAPTALGALGTAPTALGALGTAPTALGASSTYPAPQVSHASPHLFVAPVSWQARASSAGAPLSQLAGRDPAAPDAGDDSGRPRRVVAWVVAFLGLVFLGVLAALVAVAWPSIVDAVGDEGEVADQGPPLGGLYDDATSVVPKLLDSLEQPERILWFLASDYAVSMGTVSPAQPGLVRRAVWDGSRVTVTASPPMPFELQLAPFDPRELRLSVLRPMLRRAITDASAGRARVATALAHRPRDGDLCWRVAAGDGSGTYPHASLYDRRGRRLGPAPPM